MKTVTHRLIALFALTFLFIPSSSAQQQQKTDCAVRFVVVQKQDTGAFKLQPDDQDSWGQWPEDARQWWSKDGSRNFAELCEVAAPAAAFVVAWEKATVTKRVKDISTKFQEPTVDKLCDGKGGPCHEIPSYDNTITWGYRDRRLDRVLVTLYRVENEPQQLVLLSSLVKESFPDRGSGKAAFQRALDAVRKEARKSRR